MCVCVCVCVRACECDVRVCVVIKMAVGGQVSRIKRSGAKSGPGGPVMVGDNWSPRR